MDRIDHHYPTEPLPWRTNLSEYYDPIARVLGKTGINIMTRLMGLILAALAVEVMSEGLTKLFPALHGA